MIEVTLPDGSRRKLKKGSTVQDLAQDISSGLARVAVAAVLAGAVLPAVVVVGTRLLRAG